MPSAEVSVSLVLPVYDGARFLERSLYKAREWLSRRAGESELIIVDDGSKDATPAILRAFAAESGERRPRVRCLRNPINRGKGYSVRRGLLAARGQLRLFSDADLTYPLGSFTHVLRTLRRGADIAVACRVHEDSRYVVAPDFFRYIYTRHNAGRVFNWLVRATVVRELRDTQAGLKGFRASVVEDLFPRLTQDGFSFDVELLFLAQRRGYRVEEVPVTYHYARSRAPWTSRGTPSRCAPISRGSGFATLEAPTPWTRRSSRPRPERSGMRVPTRSARTRSPDETEARGNALRPGSGQRRQLRPVAVPARAEPIEPAEGGVLLARVNHQLERGRGRRGQEPLEASLEVGAIVQGEAHEGERVEGDAARRGPGAEAARERAEQAGSRSARDAVVRYAQTEVPRGAEHRVSDHGEDVHVVVPVQMIEADAQGVGALQLRDDLSSDLRLHRDAQRAAREHGPERQEAPQRIGQALDRSRQRAPEREAQVQTQIDLSLPATRERGAALRVRARHAEAHRPHRSVLHRPRDPAADAGRDAQVVGVEDDARLHPCLRARITAVNGPGRRRASGSRPAARIHAIMRSIG